MRAAVGSALLLAPSIAAACPACASDGRAFNAYHLVLLALPFVIGALAIRAIVRVLRGD